jgi:hypothetical protein
MVAIHSAYCTIKECNILSVCLYVVYVSFDRHQLFPLTALTDHLPKVDGLCYF